ncbi:MAG: hypothetical protein NT022_11625 [Deltaproteobacteria bacterium]|nr:hypothetical protein [Deltaproteobacteria bacterium]
MFLYVSRLFAGAPYHDGEVLKGLMDQRGYYERSYYVIEVTESAIDMWLSEIKLL